MTNQARNEASPFLWECPYFNDKPKVTKSLTITLLVVVTLTALVCLVTSITGGLAITGSYWTALSSLNQAITSLWSGLPYLMTAAGGVDLLIVLGAMLYGVISLTSPRKIEGKQYGLTYVDEGGMTRYSDPIEDSYQQGRQEFKEAVFATLYSKSFALESDIERLSEEEMKYVEEVVQYSDERRVFPPHIKEFQATEHKSYSHASIPGYIFKFMDDPEKYLERADRAQKICKERTLYLLDIPPCCLMQVEGKTFIMEKMLDLWSHEAAVNEAYYQWIVNDPKIQEYGEELLRQLTIFVCLHKFSDLKVNNIPLTTSGRAGLFDTDEGYIMNIDRGGAITGLVRGLRRDRIPEGIFHIIPLEWFEKFESIVKEHLDSRDWSLFVKELPKLKEDAQKRAETKSAVQVMNRRNNTHISTQPLVYDSKRIKGNDKLKKAQQLLIKHINIGIENLVLPDLTMGREIGIDFNINDPLYEEMHSQDLDKYEIELGVEALQKAQYIHSYRCPGENIYCSGWFYVIC